MWLDFARLTQPQVVQVSPLFPCECREIRTLSPGFLEPSRQCFQLHTMDFDDVCLSLVLAFIKIRIHVKANDAVQYPHVFSICCSPFTASWRRVGKGDIPLAGKHVGACRHRYLRHPVSKELHIRSRSSVALGC